jgi:hypothetical protein
LNGIVATGAHRGRQRGRDERVSYSGRERDHELLPAALPASELSDAGRCWVGSSQMIDDPEVQRFAVYLDTWRAIVTCPTCGTSGSFGAVPYAGPISK